MIAREEDIPKEIREILDLCNAIQQEHHKEPDLEINPIQCQIDGMEWVLSNCKLTDAEVIAKINYRIIELRKKL